MGPTRLILFAIAVAFCISCTDAALAAMSIDFGSQFIKIGLVKPGMPMEIVLNKESRRKTPNIVAIRNNERFFAEAAAALAVKHPKSSYQFLLDLLAKTEGSPAVENYRARFPFAALSFDDTRGTITFPSESEVFNVETLIAMVLWNCQQDAEAFAGQPVKDVVITVPVYFSQAERKAMTTAAKIAGLNLLQLLNDGSAAALNYGVFRRKEITDEPQSMLIYDMGASKTTATVVEYVLEENKQNKEKNPIVRTIGVGFDRTLGGLEMTKRMQKHLEELFRKTVKTETDIATNPRSMAKLFKEAERVKQVLSANGHHFAQIESAHEDRDFKAKVDRAEFEQLIADLEGRMVQPVEDALKMANLTIDKLGQIVLMGAGTRVPRVQAVLQAIVGEKELGRFLNTDEAIALGAVYQAAHLSKSFRVLPFGVKELQLYPIQVNFKSHNESTGEERDVSRTLFAAGSHYPAPRKTVSMTSYTDDFTISLNYGGLSHLSELQIKELGSTDLSSISVSGLKDAIAADASTEGAVFKGVKAQFELDISGIVSVTKAEAIIELLPLEVKTEDASTPEGSETNPEKANKIAADESESKKGDSETQSEAEATTAKADDGEATPKPEDVPEKKTETVEEPKNVTIPAAQPKPRTVKAKLSVSTDDLDIKPMSDELTKGAIEKLATFEKIEREKAEREAAMNGLEALVYDLAVKIEDGEAFAEFCTDEEKEKIRAETSRLRTWFDDEVGVATTTAEFQENRKLLDEIVGKINFRRKEFEEMPKAIEALNNLFNHSRNFLMAAENLTSTDDPVFTETDLDILRKLINETDAWWVEKQEVHAKQAKHDDPLVTTKDMSIKIRELDREVKYLLSKLKFHIPKTNATEEATKEKNANKGDEEAKDNEGQAEEQTSGGEESKPSEDAPKATEDPSNDDPTKKPEDSTHDASEF